MLKKLFEIPGLDLTIYSYGLLLVIGVLSAVWLAMSLARRRGMDPDVFLNAGLLALLAGVVGARITHVLENWSLYVGGGRDLGETIWDIVNIRQGGLTYYGGFLFATPALIYYGIKKKVSVRVGMDIIAPALMVGLAFGRIGCFLNGCCFGSVYEGACAVQFPYYSDAYLHHVDSRLLTPERELIGEDARGKQRLLPPEVASRDPELAQAMARSHSLPVHPTQLYSTVTALLIALLLLAAMPFIVTPGRVFALMLLIEPVTRFLLEMLRTEPIVAGGMSMSMILAIPQFAAGMLLWVGFGWYASGLAGAKQPV